VSLFDVDISTQINTLDGMPKTSRAKIHILGQ